MDNQNTNISNNPMPAQVPNISPQGYVPQATSTPSGSGTSPEVPSSPITERRFQPETITKTESPVEKAEEASKPVIVQPQPESTVIKKDEVDTEDKQFEGPSPLYGYTPSQESYKIAASTGSKVSGNVESSKTWMLLLLYRFLRMQKEKSRQAVKN